MLSSTFQFTIPEISESIVLKNLLRSFKIEKPLSRVSSLDLARFSSISGFAPLSL